MYFLVFHGQAALPSQAVRPASTPTRTPSTHPVVHAPDRTARMIGHAAHDDHAAHRRHGHHGGEPHESPAVVWVPLVLLAIPSVVIGVHRPSGRCCRRRSSARQHRRPKARAMEHVAASIGRASQAAMGWHCMPAAAAVLAGSCRRVHGLVPVLQAAGPARRDRLRKLQPLRTLLENKYYFDWFNENVLARAARACWARCSGRRATRSSSTAPLVNGSAIHGGLDGRHRAPRADRLPLYLCLLDGDWPGSAAGLVPGRGAQANTHKCRAFRFFRC